jgi:hypothetical protein
MRGFATIALPLVLLGARPAHGAEAAPPKAACSAQEFRRFDFWLGQWDVTNTQAPDPARPPAKSHITRLLDGCAILEEFDNAARGYAGKSLNFYSPLSHTWHQTWIDNQGGPLFLEGGLDGKNMVLQDDGKGGAINRITWTPLDAGRVRQHWEISKDGGKTWATSFDGLYTPRAAAP